MGYESSRETRTLIVCPPGQRIDRLRLASPIVVLTLRLHSGHSNSIDALSTNPFAEPCADDTVPEATQPSE
jgi:hypothetical protein